MNQIQLTSALLKYTQSIDWLSTVLLVLTVLATYAAPFSFSVVFPLLLTGLIGIVVKYISLRLSFDREIFAHFSQLPLSQLNQETDALDEGLISLHLVIPKKPQRTWADRCNGAIYLLRTQFILTCLQTIFFLIACTLVYI